MANNGLQRTRKGRGEGWFLFPVLQWPRPFQAAEAKRSMEKYMIKTISILTLFIVFSAFSCHVEEQKDVVTLTNYIGKTYQEMLNELGAPADKTGYTIENAPIKRWNHGELFSKYPKNEKNKNVQIMEVTWEDGDFGIHACYHMINKKNVCFIAKRIRKGIRY